MADGRSAAYAVSSAEVGQRGRVTMYAIRQHEFGPAENLLYEEVPDPVPAEGQVRSVSAPWARPPSPTISSPGG